MGTVETQKTFTFAAWNPDVEKSESYKERALAAYEDFVDELIEATNGEESEGTEESGETADAESTDEPTSNA